MPSQHSAVASQRMPTPVGPKQHWSEADPGKHCPPHFTRPSPHGLAQPWPAARQTPPQHCAPASQMMPEPLGPRQQVSDSFPAMHSPPQETMPGAHVESQAVPSAAQTPSQHTEFALQMMPAPDGPTQHLSSVVPTIHSPPHFTKPSPHFSAQASPSATQTPSQHWALLSHMMPAPDGPRQHVSSSEPTRHSPPQRTSPSPHCSAQP
mmetsp:Transcript_142788/g.371981  ORF Transcript_142788/g.371981 Transcript_142788/m.371981 type:complete len:207 (+) Transcript_142788:241-861(+)